MDQPLAFSQVNPQHRFGVYWYCLLMSLSEEATGEYELGPTC
jgi:hypothetical protein